MKSRTIDGGRLREIRELERGLTQEELARRVGVDPSYITHLERGTRQPSAATYKAICKALRIPLHRCLKDEPEPEAA